MNYTLFTWDRKTNIGTVFQTGDCPEKLLPRQPRQGQSILVGTKLDPVKQFVRLEAELRDGEYVIVGAGKTICNYSDAEQMERAGPAGKEELALERDKVGLAQKGINPALADRLAQRRKYKPQKAPAGQAGA